MTTIRLTSTEKRKLQKAQEILEKRSARKWSQGEVVAALAEFALRHRIDELEAALVEWARGPADDRYGFSDIRPLRIRPGPSLTEMVRRAREHRHEVPPRRQRRS